MRPINVSPKELMSRNVVILVVVMCAAIAGLLIFGQRRSTVGPAVPPPATSTPVAQNPPGPGPGTTPTPVPNPVTPSIGPRTTPGVGTPVQPVQPGVGSTPQNATLQTGFPVRVGSVPVMTNGEDDLGLKPLPVLEKNYLATTNRDDRLDLMMDITDWPGPEAVRTLTKLFAAETDPELKVDLVDSLLGIEGQTEEKLKLLQLATEKNNALEVRQSAIDGLIDLEDQRVIPILNGLLNDPNEEIRESAKDALEMLQSQPAVKVQPLR